jgi:phage terminase large subunit GpA-like protein
MAPPPKLTISQWADRYRKLSSEGSAEPGAWRTARAEYQREIMDTISAPGVERVCVIKSSQVGWTEILNNAVGYHISHDPAPVLMLQPTLEMAETISKDRLAPMFRDTPVLREKVADAKSRDSGNTMLHKRFPGGHVTLVGANSPSSLASRPIRVLLADEVDRYPPSAGSEGDPLALTIKRTTTFWNRRILIGGTPTVKGQSRIEQEWLVSDQRRYHVPCIHCGHEQTLQWANVKWPDGKPDQAALNCTDCGAVWTEADRLRAVRKGRWIVTRPEGRFPGFHINELYSPWSTVAKVAIDFVEAKKSPELLKVWVNTSLGETWESDSERIDHHALAERLEDFGEKGDAGHIAPLSVLRITCGVDVQADRLEIERVGWGMHDESWSLDHHVIVGDPSDPGLWARLDAYLSMPTEREDGRDLPVSATCVDSGGHHTQAVYRFCRVRKNRRIFAIKGRDEAITVWPSQSKVSKGKVADVTIVGVSVAKDAVYARLKVGQPGPGYCHFPRGRAPGYFEQLVSEVIETRYSFGRPRRVYILPDGKRNEALDCRVYAFAALQSLSIRWVTEQEAMAAHPPKVTRVVAPEVAAQALAQRPAQQQTRAPARNPFARGSSNPFRR